jgi:glutaredoxin
MKLSILILAVLANLSFHDAHAQTIYKSTAANGTVVYSDRPPANGKVDETITYVDLPSSPLPAAAAQQIEHAARQTSAPARRQYTGVTLYTTSWCGYCKRARAYLAQKGIDYRDIDIEAPGGAAAFAQAGGRGGVPLLVADGRHVRGFSLAGYDAVFGGH